MPRQQKRHVEVRKKNLTAPRHTIAQIFTFYPSNSLLLLMNSDTGSYSLKRIIIAATGLILLATGGSIVLLITAARVGEHKSSTFGQAYENFENSWGGEIQVSPPRFFLRTSNMDSALANGRTIRKTVPEDIELFPTDIRLNTTLDYHEQIQEWISFNAYQATSKDRFTVKNTTRDSGALFMEFNMPQEANLMNKIKVMVNGSEQLQAININKRMLIIPSIFPGDSTSVGLNYSLKGMDLYQYNLSEYSENVTGHLQALFKVNTPKYEIYQFGIPHSVNKTKKGSEILFSMDNFASNQSLGIVFYNQIMYLDKMEKMMYYSSISLILFLLVIFFYAQIRNRPISGIHYFFTAAIHVFYFLFIAYLIRFFGIWLSIGISSVLTYMMAILYFPKVFGKSFFLNIIIPHLLLLSIIFTLIFLMPVFQGISFLIMNFIILITIMLAITRSEISEWQIMKG